MKPYTKYFIDQPIHLRNFITQFKSKQNIFLRAKRYIDMESKITNKTFLFSSKPQKNSFVPLYPSCKHAKLKTLITRLDLHQMYDKRSLVDTLVSEKNQIGEDIVCTCKLEWGTTVMLLLSTLGVTGSFSLKDKKFGICKGIYDLMLPV